MFTYIKNDFKVIKDGLSRIDWPNWFYSYFWTNLWYNQVSTRFNPRNKWATKSIPRQFRDIDGIYENIIYNGLVSYIEEQEAFETIDWSGDRKHRLLKKRLQEIYDWVKTGRPKASKEMEDAYPKCPNFSLTWTRVDYKREYGKVDKIDKYINDKDNKYLIFLVKNRKYLWT